MQKPLFLIILFTSLFTLVLTGCRETTRTVSIPAASPSTISLPQTNLVIANPAAPQTRFIIQQPAKEASPTPTASPTPVATTSSESSPPTLARPPVVSTQPSVTITVPNAQTLDDVQNSAKLGNLTCQNAADCEPAVAMLSIVRQDGWIERCTGFLISEDEILTSDHCLTASAAVKGFETESKNISCENLAFAHFVGMSGSSTGITVACDSIEYRSLQNGINTEDYAVLKLSEKLIDRSPLKLSTRGFQDQEKANLVRVQMNADDGTRARFDGVQTKLSCDATIGTNLDPSISSSDSALMSFGNCLVQGGNSGAPILETDGTVGAIEQGYLTAAITVAKSQTSYREVMLGTQSVCMADGLGNTSVSCTTPAPLLIVSE